MVLVLVFNNKRGQKCTQFSIAFILDSKHIKVNIAPICRQLQKEKRGQLWNTQQSLSNSSLNKNSVVHNIACLSKYK